MYNSRASELAIYLRTYLRAAFHRSGMNSLRARSALVLHESHTVGCSCNQNGLDSGDSQ